MVGSEDVSGVVVVGSEGVSGIVGVVVVGSEGVSGVVGIVGIVGIVVVGSEDVFGGVGIVMAGLEEDVLSAVLDDGLELLEEFSFFVSDDEVEVLELSVCSLIDGINEEVCDVSVDSDEEGTGSLQAHSVIAIIKQRIVVNSVFTFANIFI